MTSVAARQQSPPTTEPQSEFVKAMSLTDATMLVAGSMIGSGIFIVSADIARKVGSPGFLLLAWILTGVITLLGALAYGELAAMYPRAGGQYVFLRESMGPLMGFLYGWTLFVVIQTGTIAAVAVAFGRFLGVLWPGIGPELYGWFPQGRVCMAMLGCTDPANAINLGLSPQRLIALLSIAVLTWINVRGVREAKIVQTSLTIVKTGALAALILLALTVGRNVTFAAAEVREPQRNLPRALVYGTGLVSLLYVLANVAYLNVLPFAGSADAPTALGRGIAYAAQDRVGT